MAGHGVAISGRDVLADPRFSRALLYDGAPVRVPVTW